MFRRLSFVKSVGLLVGLLVVLPAHVLADWEFQDSGTTENLNDICFVDELHGWAVGDNSTIIHTENGGETWVRQECPVGRISLKKVHFLSQGVGYCCGDSSIYSISPYGVILKTINFGKDWIRLETGYEIKSVFDIYSMNENQIWLLFESKFPTYNYIIHSDNGGKSWNEQFKTNYYIHSIDFSNSQTGWVISTFGDDYTYLFQTNNGGQTWIEGSIFLGNYYNISFVGDDALWIWYKGLAFSNDGGFSWESKKNGNIHLYPWIACPIDEKKVFTVFLNHDSSFWSFSYSDDGGHVFSSLFTVENDLSEARSVKCLDNVIWIVGTKGCVIKYHIKPLYINEKQESPQVISLYNYPNPFNTSTTISFTLKQDKDVRLSIHDTRGCEIALLINSWRAAGTYSIVFDTMGYASGVYFYRLDGNDFSQCEKMLLIK